MASLQLASMWWPSRTVNKYCRLQQPTSGITKVCRFVTCKFSTSAGPVRYIPKHINLPNHLEGEQKNSDSLSSEAQRRLDVDSGSCRVKRKDNKLFSAQRLQCNEEIHEEKVAISRGTTQPQNSSRGRDLRIIASQRSCTDLPINVQTDEGKCASSHVDPYNASAIEDGSEAFLKSSGKFRLSLNKGFVPCSSSPANEENKLREQKATDIKGKEGPLCHSSQDIEGFLWNAQQVKRRSSEGHTNSDSLIAGNDHFGIDDISICNNEGGGVICLTLGQDTIDDACSTTEESLDIRSTVAQEHAKNMAIRYLAMRPYTAFQLRKKLESQNISSELSEYALAAIQRSGLQSDLAYAETFSRGRFNHGGWGPKKIKLGLRQRGISDDIIQEAIATVFHGDGNVSDSNEGCESRANELSKTAMEHLLVQASKQWRRGQNATNQTKVRRMVGWLQYRGYSYGIIKTVLNHLQKEIRIEDDI